MKKYIIIWVILGCFTENAFGQRYLMELVANDTDVEGYFGVQQLFNDIILEAGFGATGRVDNSSLYSIYLCIKDNIVAPGLTLGMGFRGTHGEGEVEEVDYDVGAFSFYVSGEFDFREVSNMPLRVMADVALAPEPLSYMDTKNFAEYSVCANLFLVKDAGIIARYRKTVIRYDKDPNTVTQDEGSVFLGFRLAF